MDKPRCAILFDFIRQTEVGRSDRASYDVIYGHNQGKLPKPLTAMTYDEIVDAQAKWSKRVPARPVATSSCGRRCRIYRGKYSRSAAQTASRPICRTGSPTSCSCAVATRSSSLARSA